MSGTPNILKWRQLCWTEWRSTPKKHGKLQVGFDSVLDGWEDYDFWCKFIEHAVALIFVAGASMQVSRAFEFRHSNGTNETSVTL